MQDCEKFIIFAVNMDAKRPKQRKKNPQTQQTMPHNSTRRMAALLLLGGALATAPSPLDAQPNYDLDHMQMDRLGRGLVAVRQAADSVSVSWRYLREDPDDVTFDLYRNGKKIAADLTDATYYTDAYAGSDAAAYRLVARSKTGKVAKRLADVAYTLPADAPVGYIDIPISQPEDGWLNFYESYHYTAGDASAGDVDGDGEFEIILKWDPSNAHDNSHYGYSGNVYVDCYRLSGELLWRIDLGPNIRAGAHYTQFMVYDLDGDGRAEVIMKTADGTVDGQGTVIGDPDVDYANERGYILDGPEYLTVFDGLTGRALATTDYLPQRGDVKAWGDEYGNRVDRFLACVAYLDGRRASVVMCRGYYTRTVLAAWDWDGRELRNRWTFDTDQAWHDYAGQGNHNLRVGDVDADGCDEIIYGAMAVNHDGTALHNTHMGHGDAMHLTAFIPGDPRLQVWDCHENRRDGSTLRDAKTGQIIFQVKSSDDVGRAMAADIDPTSPGVEMWTTDSHGIRNYKGEVVCAEPKRLSCNMAVWWDGDLLRELYDGTTVSKWNWRTQEAEPLVRFEGVTRINGTKSNPCLQADLLGDWREEVLLPTADQQHLRLYVTPYATDYRFHTFLQDPVYRISIATQNVAYNQPTQPGFYFGPDLKKGERFRGTVIR